MAGRTISTVLLIRLNNKRQSAFIRVFRAYVRHTCLHLKPLSTKVETQDFAYHEQPIANPIHHKIPI